MTLSYSSELSTTKPIGTFWKLLIRWKGSIYKLVWADLILYMVLYHIIQFSYSCLSGITKKTFVDICIYCSKTTETVPLSFVLGFYVTIVVQRWWDQYMSLPWPDSTAVLLTSTIHGNTERAIELRTTIIRYVNLAFVYTMSHICPPVKKQFLSLQHFIDAELLTPSESEMFAQIGEKSPYLKNWLPLTWAGNIVTLAYEHGFIKNKCSVALLLEEIEKQRRGVASILCYNYVSVPLVYTQTVIIVVYCYFLAQLFGAQFVNEEPNIYIPVVCYLQFLFYLGWLRVAETLLNPFGDDDQDFEIIQMITRNIQVSRQIVSDMSEQRPHLIEELELIRPRTDESSGSSSSSSTASTPNVDRIRGIPDPSPSSKPLKPSESETERRPISSGSVPSSSSTVVIEVESDDL